MLTQEALQHMLRLPLRLAFVETSFLQQRTWTAGLGARSGGFLHLQGFGDTASLGLEPLGIKASHCIDLFPSITKPPRYSAII